MTIDLNDYLPSVADFPRPGVVFRDICPLLASPEAFAQCTEGLAAAARGRDVTRIAGIESRGLVFATALALNLRLPLVPIRKQGKLPPPVVRAQYALEYGSDSLEVQSQAIRAGESVLIVDDVIATGGTVLAAAQLVRQLGGIITGVAAVLEIGFLGGSERLRAAGLPVHALVQS